MEHTSKLIKGSLSDSLKEKRIALCVTGSVAAVECVALARRLMRHGAEVYAVMSREAQKIIHPNLLEWATGNPVVTELTGQIEHVTLAGKHDNHVDLVLIAPSTANTIGKVANGIDDTPVTTTVSSAIGAGIPVVVVPAMHESMYDHPAVIENIGKLKRMGLTIVTPRVEEAKAKIPDVDTIVEHVMALLGPRDLDGKHFIVTAGPTRGWIDRVRFISNPSSGKMGVAVAEELLSRGAHVTLILGPTTVATPAKALVKHVTTPEEMMSAVLESLDSDEIDAFVSAAAVLDYVPSKKVDSKMPSGEPSLAVELRPTKKIIEEARKKKKGLLIVGFKVESGITEKELEKRARAKIESGVCDLVVANDEHKKGVAFGADTNEVLIVSSDSVREIELAPKRVVARHIVDVIVEKMNA
ncbi:MAG: bifunctional phosphopantothenoylcysteine decarboxylase/phosphopantothenate--cysteine ligase CoaBC [Candidatus Thorarchaeota archaeon]|nr:MAG: bifunctional phosphopantothenoylcysteine decarboxylase/phosphopantothenate--cysteine ligase CoaBC [Candidatus Thorarchaeota archaeon]RLI60089.1 MAG: bifunctional phosphopantothenoylcysteine decarboxylase/phosphopantothenate--cysteine ligase CoaBC [Candidatus Thorarchaeota archaeon]